MTGGGGAWRYKTYGGWVAAGAHDVMRTPGPPQTRRRLAFGPGSSPWQRACGCWQCDHDRQTHRAVEAAADRLAAEAG